MLYIWPVSCIKTSLELFITCNLLQYLFMCVDCKAYFLISCITLPATLWILKKSQMAAKLSVTLYIKLYYVSEVTLDIRNKNCFDRRMNNSYALGPSSSFIFFSRSTFFEIP